MRIPREDPSIGTNRTLQTMGILGILLGLLMLVATVTNRAWQYAPGLGYIVGLGMIFFGILRVMRGSRGQKR
jgi:uncharacterized membrane protein HdeD (DUF308 family)